MKYVYDGARCGLRAAPPESAPPAPAPDLLATLVDALAERIGARLSASPPDTLVPIAADAIDALGLELRAVQRLIADGRLKAVEIGRRKFTKASYLLALVDELPAVGRAHAVAVDGHDELQEAFAAAARRRAARSA
jgi:hypothetical protein